MWPCVQIMLDIIEPCNNRGNIYSTDLFAQQTFILLGFVFELPTR